MNQGEWILLAAVLLACAFGGYRMLRDGRFRAARAAVDERAAAPDPSVLAGTEHPLGERATLLQFSSAFCAPCRTTRARLQQLQTTRPGLAYVHVDAESHLEEVRELDVRRTPTLFYLRRDGSVLARSSGAPQPEQLTALVDAHVGAQQ